MDIQYLISLTLVVQTEKSVDMLLRGRNPMVEVHNDVLKGTDLTCVD